MRRPIKQIFTFLLNHDCKITHHLHLRELAQMRLVQRLIHPKTHRHAAGCGIGLVVVFVGAAMKAWHIEIVGEHTWEICTEGVRAFGFAPFIMR